MFNFFKKIFKNKHDDNIIFIEPKEKKTYILIDEDEGKKEYYEYDKNDVNNKSDCIINANRLNNYKLEEKMPIVPELSEKDIIDNNNMIIVSENGEENITSEQLKEYLYTPNVPNGIEGFFNDNLSKLTGNKNKNINKNINKINSFYVNKDVYKNTEQDDDTQIKIEKTQNNQMKTKIKLKRDVDEIEKSDYPYYELYTIDYVYHLLIDLPGINEETLDIEYVDGTITISGVREPILNKIKGRKKIKDDSSVENISTIPKFLIGNFSFDFNLKKIIDENNVTAKYENGILHLIMPHKSKGDKIKIGIKR